MLSNSSDCNLWSNCEANVVFSILDRSHESKAINEYSKSIALTTPSAKPVDETAPIGIVSTKSFNGKQEEYAALLDYEGKDLEKYKNRMLEPGEKPYFAELGIAKCIAGGWMNHVTFIPEPKEKRVIDIFQAALRKKGVFGRGRCLDLR